LLKRAIISCGGPIGAFITIFHAPSTTTAELGGVAELVAADLVAISLGSTCAVAAEYEVVSDAVAIVGFTIDLRSMT
jgi:hypothetical protein